MKSPFTLARLPITLLLVFAFIACGGDDDASDSGDDVAATTVAATEDIDDDDSTTDRGDLEAYYAAMEELAVRTNGDLNSAAEPLQQDFADEDEYITTVQEAFRDAGEILETTLLELSEMDPPSELIEAHLNFFGDLQERLIITADFSADAEDVTAGAEMDALINEYDSAFMEADEDFEDSCLDLQLIADVNEVAVDLLCLS